MRSHRPPFFNLPFLMITRRTLLRNSAGTLAGAMLTHPRAAWAHGSATAPIPGAVTEFRDLPTAGDDRLRMLIATAVDAAKSAGAIYADARLTFSQRWGIEADGINASSGRGSFPANRFETMVFGVRAQYDGYWGFASSPVWAKDEAARLGRVAVDCVKANVSGRPRDLEMAPNPKAVSGDWTMPVTDDPFTMDPDEIYDYLSGALRYWETLQNELGLGVIALGDFGTTFFRQQKAFGSTDGQFVTQRVYQTGAKCGFMVEDRPGEGLGTAGGFLDQFTMAGAGRGFESIRTPHTREWMRQLYEALDEERRLPMLPIDVGRYPVLVHRGGVAGLLKKSVGVATEIDRVMGYEANTSGTSYIMDPDVLAS